MASAGRLVILATLTLPIVCLRRDLLLAQQPPVVSGSNEKTIRTCPYEQNYKLWPDVVAKCGPKFSHDEHACVKYDLDKKYVITKDTGSAKPVAYLIIPMEQMKGVEDSRIFQLPYLNLWEYGLEESITYPGPRPGHIIGMAINAKCARVDGQLHIHISCVGPRLLKKLKESDPIIPYAPGLPLTLPDIGGVEGTYRVIKVKALSDQNSPFEVVRNFPGAKENMADQGIAVIPTQKLGEYYVLNTIYGGSGNGHAEELLDQTCALQ